VNAVTILMLFFLARRLLRDNMAAAVSAIAYGFFSIDRSVLGVFGHATHFVVLAAVAGLLVLFRALESTKPPMFLAAGVLLGLSVLMKQNGIFFLALGIGLATWN
jgi:4-amino-4-deoxy-L-arabinose transferase-like glycosyltransferase